MKKIYKTPIVRSCIIDTKDVLLSNSTTPFSLDNENPADETVVVDSRTNYNVWDSEW